MLNFLKKYYIPITIAGFIILALIFRLFLLFQRGSFWFDEMFSVYFSGFELNQIWQYMLHENNPPLHIFLLHFWGWIFELNEYSARGLSIILNIASIIAIYFVGRKMFSKKVAVFAAFFVAISSFQILFSVEARSFSLMFFLGLISIYFFWDIFESNKKTSWCVYILISVFLLFTHLFAWFLIIAQNIVFLIYLREAPRDKNLKRWIYSQLFLFGIFLIWFIPAFFTKVGVSISAGWYFNLEYSGSIILNHLTNFLIIGNENYIIDGLIKILIIILCISSFASIKKLGNLKIKLTPQILFCIILAFLPVVASFMYTKYFIVCSIGFYLLLAKGLEKLNLNYKIYILILLIIFSLTLNSILNISLKLNHKWDKIGEFISENESVADKVIVSRFNNILLVDNYYNGSLPVEGFLPINEKDKDDDLNIIKYNWLYYLTSENVKELSKLIGNSEKILLVYKPLDKHRLVEKWFLQNNWKVLEHKIFSGTQEPPEIIIFEKIL